MDKTVTFRIKSYYRDRQYRRVDFAGNIKFRDMCGYVNKLGLMCIGRTNYQFVKYSITNSAFYHYQVCRLMYSNGKIKQLRTMQIKFKQQQEESLESALVQSLIAKVTASYYEPQTAKPDSNRKLRRGIQQEIINCSYNFVVCVHKYFLCLHFDFG